MTRKKQRQKATNFIRKGTGLSMADSAKIARIFSKGDQGWDAMPKSAETRYKWFYCTCCAPSRYGVEDIEGPKGTVTGKDIENFFS